MGATKKKIRKIIKTPFEKGRAAIFHPPPWAESLTRVWVQYQRLVS
jgi:hypothetical protein